MLLGDGALLRRAARVYGHRWPSGPVSPSERDLEPDRGRYAGGAGGTMSAAVEVRAATITFHSGPPWDRRKVHAVRGVTVEIEQGRTFGLVGESGSGKTTLGRLCVGILRPDRGEVRVDGVSLTRGRRRLRGQLQVVGQHPQWALNPRLRIGTSIMEPLVISGK